MPMNQCMIAEIEMEAAKTRRFYERIPEDKLDFKPHEKSMTVGQLALHMVNSPTLVCRMGAHAQCDISVFAADYQGNFRDPESVQQILDLHDASIPVVKAALEKLTDEDLKSNWAITKDGHPLLEMPRAVFFRNVLLNHTYHHRGQLSLYLRLLAQQVPTSFGPSGDEIPAEFIPVVEAMQELHASA